MQLRSKTVFFSVFAAVLCGALALASATSFAALDKGRYSSLEKLGFAFHTLSGIAPHFDRWIEKRDDYLNATPVEKYRIMHADMTRLETGMQTYEPDTDLIEIDSPVRMYFSDPADPTDPEAITTVKINLNDLPDNNFIPFQIGDLWVALVVKDFDSLTNLSLTQEQMQHLSSQDALKSYTRLRTVIADMELYLRPLSVDTKAPVQVDGLEMWMMLADVAYMEIGRGHKEVREYFWQYQAPWYKAARQQELDRLYWKN